MKFIYLSSPDDARTLLPRLDKRLDVDDDDDYYYSCYYLTVSAYKL